jgi:hypothetical protein
MDEEQRRKTYVANGVLVNVHPASACSGYACWVHRPSDHHMVEWPVTGRFDKAVAERVCPHGVGHPDPDDVAYNDRIGRDISFHGCDGCCAGA